MQTESPRSSSPVRWRDDSDSESTSTRSDEVTHLLRELETMYKSKSVAQQIFADILQIDSGLHLQNPESTYQSLRKLLKKDEDNLYAASRLAELIRLYPHIHRDEPFDIQGVFKELRVKHPSDPFSYARLAMCSKKLGLWSDARELLEEALTKDSDDFFSLMQLAILCRKREKKLEPDLKMAKRCITKALKLRPQELSCIENLAEIERLSGNIGKAKKLFEGMLSQQRRPFTLSRLGEIFRIGGEGIAKNCLFAQKLFLEAEQIKPTNSFVLSRLGAIAVTGGEGVSSDTNRAEDLFMRVLKMRPHDPFALGRLGDLRRQQKKFKEAKQLLHSSYEGFSDDPFTLTSYAILLRQMPKRSAQDRILATSLMEKARRLAPSDPLINERDRTVSQVGIEEVQTDQKRKRDLLVVALHQEPTNIYNMLALGKELMTTDPKEAKKLFEGALQSNPSNIAALEYMSDYYATCEKYGVEQAVNYLEKAYKLDKKNSELCLKLAKLVSRFERGKNRNLAYAKKILEEACAKNPQNAAVLAALGEFLRVERKDMVRACKLIQESLEIEKNADALASLGHLFLTGEGGLDKDVEKARSHFDAALIIDPEHELALEGRSTIFDEITL